MGTLKKGGRSVSEEKRGSARRHVNTVLKKERRKGCVIGMTKVKGTTNTGGRYPERGEPTLHKSGFA